MCTLITPSVWRTHIPIAVDSLGTTPPEGLVTGIRAPSEPYTLDNRTVVVMRDPTCHIGILQLKVPAMAADAMELRGWGQRGEESGKCCEDVGCGWRDGWWACQGGEREGRGRDGGEVCEGVGVQSLCGDGGDEGA